jgi:anti-sigma factor RsiW
MNTSCPQIRRLLVEYLYEELPEDQATLVRLHLEQCPSCREEFELCQRLLATIDTATRADVSANRRASSTHQLANRSSTALSTTSQIFDLYHSGAGPGRFVPFWNFRRSVFVPMV